MEGSRYRCDGLPTGDVLISEVREEVTESTVCQYFGPKSSKSGWKYTCRTTVEEQAQILSLYRKVYECDDPPNKEITLSFARGLILMTQGVSVNWAQFAEERRKVREALRKKSEERKEKRERERELEEGKERSGAVSAPSVLGKKRCTIERQDLGFPGSLSLSVKTESGAEGWAMARKSTTKSGRVSAGGPRWGREEIDGVVRAINCHEGLVTKCQNELEESRREVEAVEDNLRREKLLLSDCQRLMLDEVKLRLSRMSSEELPLQRTLEEKIKSLDDLHESSPSESGDALRRDIAALSTKRDGFAFTRASDEVTARLCGEAIVGCRGKIDDLDTRLEESTKIKARTECRVSSLQTVLLSMREQLKRMHVGDGAALFPVPLESSPQVPLVEEHTLNACPVCSLWFECYDYASLACGHTYHPYCLYEYSQKATNCLVPCCREPFAARNLAALGIRPVTRPEVVKDHVRGVTVDLIPSKSNGKAVSGATTGARTSPTSSWGKESPEKVTPLSQSSQTEATSKPSNSNLLVEKTPSPPEMCEVCGEKEVSVFVKACGHNTLCFGCIQGRKECPICGQALSGWGRNNPRLKQSLPLDVTRAAPEIGQSGGARASTTTAEKESERAEERAEHTVEAGASGDDSSDDSDSDNGLVHWCGTEEFSNGGARSHQDRLHSESPVQEEESDLPTNDVNVGSRGAKRFATVSVLLDTVKTGPELEEEPVVRKRGRPRLPNQTRGKKFKKVGDMAADANVGPAPSAAATETAEPSHLEHMSVQRKRSVGCPSNAAKISKHQKGSQVPKQTSVKSNSVPVQQLRSTLRRREVQDTIPVKFRGM